MSLDGDTDGNRRRCCTWRRNGSAWDGRDVGGGGDGRGRGRATVQVQVQVEVQVQLRWEEWTRTWVTTCQSKHELVEWGLKVGLELVCVMS
jgi:hypothetical protein